MKDRKTAVNMSTPPKREHIPRIRKPNPRIYGSDDESSVTQKLRRQTKSTVGRGEFGSPDKKTAHSLGVRLRNLLKLPKAHAWVCHEWFYSSIDQALFHGENDFSLCLKESFPPLKTRMLTRLQWSKIRRLMGKPRRCSSSFFAEERAALQRRRQKVRLLQQRKAAEVTEFKDIPEEIPLPLVIGTRVTARLRKPHDGLFSGIIDALDTVNNTYRITFDRVGFGTYSVPDIDVVSDEQQDTMPLSSFYVRKRPARQILFSPPHYLSKTTSPGLTSDPLLSCLPNKGNLLLDGSTLGGFPVKFLVLVTRLTKLLAVKKDVVSEVKAMNTEAERMKSHGEEFTVPFQQRYASLILELERINRDLNEYLIGVQQCCHEIDPEKSLSLLDQPMEIRKKCEAEAEAMVKKTNAVQGKRRVRDEKSLQLVSKLMSLLLQIRTFADSEMHAFEFKSLQDSLDEIKASISPLNISVLQNSIEIHIHHIQNGLTQIGNLHAFAISQDTT